MNFSTVPPYRSIVLRHRVKYSESSSRMLSGSLCSDRVVKPTRSANSTVTRRRSESPRIGRRSGARSGLRGMCLERGPARGAEAAAGGALHPAGVTDQDLGCATLTTEALARREHGRAGAAAAHPLTRSGAPPTAGRTARSGARRVAGAWESDPAASRLRARR